MIAPRPYQLEGIQRVRVAFAAAPSVVLVLPTGGGKTIIGSWIIKNALEVGTRSLFVAHRVEIIRQTFCKLVRNGIAIQDVGVIMGSTPADRGGELFPADVSALDDDELWSRFGRRRPGAKVQVGSIDTLRVRAKTGDFDLIIIDEAHRALAQSYKTLVAAHPGAFVLGLTATPYRADGEGLEDLFDDLVSIASPAALVADGFLVEPTIWRPKLRADLSGVKLRGGDYETAALGGAMNRAELVGSIVDHWKEHAFGVRTVAFACGVEHSKSIAQRFVEAGVAAEHLDGETPAVERAAILRRLDKGETIVVSNCGVLCEGWDQPSVKCCILARPTKSTGLYLQQAGRILRPWKGQPAIILDHAGCFNEHGGPTDDREFSLKGNAKLRANAGAQGRECPDCGLVVANAARVCPNCGVELGEPKAGGLEVAETDDKLERVTLTQSERDLELVLAIEADWRKRNAKRAAPLKPGWIFYRFKDKTRGRRPPSSYKLPTLTDEEERKRGELEKLLAKSVESGYSPAWAHVQAAQKLAELPRAVAEVAASGPKAPGEATDQSPRSDPAPGAGGTQVVDPWDRPRKRPAPTKSPAPPAFVDFDEVAF